VGRGLTRLREEFSAGTLGGGRGSTHNLAPFQRDRGSDQHAASTRECYWCSKEHVVLGNSGQFSIRPARYQYRPSPQGNHRGRLPGPQVLYQLPRCLTVAVSRPHQERSVLHSYTRTKWSFTCGIYCASSTSTHRQAVPRDVPGQSRPVESRSRRETGRSTGTSRPVPITSRQWHADRKVGESISMMLPGRTCQSEPGK
jgi:hypothetical protein